MAKQNSKKRSCMGCGAGCLGVLLAAIGMIAAIYPTRGNYRPHIPPVPPLPRSNALDDYIAAGQILKANGGLKAIESAVSAKHDYEFYYDGLKTGRIRPGAKPVPKIPPDIRLVNQQVVASNQPALARMRQGLLKQCQVPALRTGSAYSYVHPIRELTQVLKLEAEGYASQGDFKSAFSNSMDVLKLAYDVERGGNFDNVRSSAQLSEIAIRIAANAVGRLSLRDCAMFETRMRTILESKSPLSAAAQEEGWYTLSRLLDLDEKVKSFSSGIYIVRSYGGLAVASTYNCYGPPSEPDVVDKGVMAIGRACWHTERDAILKDVESYYRALKLVVDKPAALRQPLPKFRSYIEQQYIYFTEDSLAKLDTALARVRLAYCMLRLRRFYLESRHYPPSLADLGIPRDHSTDPFSGKPLIYQKSSDGYLLYSIGPDLKDDGGVPMVGGYGETSGDIGVIATRGVLDPVTHLETLLPVPHMNPPKPLPSVPTTIQ